MLKLELGFARAAQKHFCQFDIVQSHERIPGCNIFRAGDGVHKVWLKQRERLSTAKEAQRLYNDRFHQYVMRAEKSMFEHPALKAVICNSNMVRSEIIANFAIDPNIIHVIYNSVDHSVFNPDLKGMFRQKIRQQLSIPEEAPTLLYVGSGFERKGLKASIEAIAKTNSHLIVVGQDKQIPKYQRMAELLDCQNRIHFLGMQKEPKAFYGAADGFIIPTLYDPFPNVILEAMASGLGVITSTTCGGAEIIENGRNGFVCDALDTTALANAISAFENTDTSRQMGAEACKTVESFTSEKLCEELMGVYQKVFSV